MLRVNKIAIFDRVIDVLELTPDDTGAERIYTSSTRYSQIPAALLKSSGTEKEEEFQTVGLQKKSYLIRKLDRTFDNTMEIKEGSDVYQIISVDPFGSDRAHLVVNCVKRDNA